MSHRGLLHHMVINVSDVKRSSPFYAGMFSFFGYELADSSYVEEYGYEDWKRWDLDRADVDQFHESVLAPLAHAGHCSIEDAPCDCPEYGDGYYATFFYDPDGLKYEFVFNPGHLNRKAERDSRLAS